MSGGRRSAIVVEAARRLVEQGARVGADIRASRGRRGWTQEQLAERAGLTRHVVGRIERAATRLDVDALQRISIALGRPLEIRFGRDALEQPTDAGHLAMQELVLRLGRACGYTGTFELPTRPAEPWRSVDVGLAAPGRRILILNECWNTFGDVGAAARSSMRKLAELENVAIARWGTEARVGLVWVVRATARNRALLARYPENLCQPLPRLVAGVGRGAYDERATAGGTRPRVVRRCRNATVRVAATVLTTPRLDGLSTGATLAPSRRRPGGVAPESATQRARDGGSRAGPPA